jgi:hypothetical protein
MSCQFLSLFWGNQELNMWKCYKDPWFAWQGFFFFFSFIAVMGGRYTVAFTHGLTICQICHA